MHALTNKPELAARFCSALIKMAQDTSGEVDMMKLTLYLAGVLSETYLIFENPPEAMEGSFDNLAKWLNCDPLNGELAEDVLPPAHQLDRETEQGRALARQFFEEWLDCEFEFHSFMLTVVQGMIVSWEAEGIYRAESFRLLIECIRRCMTYEIAAQELCDIVIEHKIAREAWSLGDCVASLSAVAGRRLALSVSTQYCEIFKGSDLPENLDCVVYVMTQEAVRLGVPAGSDWRFGLAANDVPINAPVQLIEGIEPFCAGFFQCLNVDSLFEQAVCCAKAAGRMVAVAAGGELPEMEPAIAKPLAMSAMAESYKFVCQDQAIVSC